MKVLYKYMPFRVSFFDDPLLRLTPPSALNDPFDSKPTQLAINKKSDFFFNARRADDDEPDDDELRSFYENDLRHGLEKFGIISLTENHKNLLMWSHYAKDHSGVVIEVSNEHPIFNYHHLTYRQCGVSKQHPIKVEYTNIRPGQDIPETAIYEYFEYNFYTHFATVKGTPWEYEQEYRYLLTLDEADVGLVRLLKKIEDIQEPRLSVRHVHEDLYKVEYTSPEDRELLKWYLAIHQGRGNICDVILFKRLSRDAIKAIYFGCRVSDDSIKEARNRIIKSGFYSKEITFYKGKESDDLFEIDFEEVNFHEEY